MIGASLTETVSDSPMMTYFCQLSAGKHISRVHAHLTNGLPVTNGYFPFCLDDISQRKLREDFQFKLLHDFFPDDWNISGLRHPFYFSQKSIRIN